jgi:hypothetical protein
MFQRTLFRSAAAVRQSLWSTTKSGDHEFKAARKKDNKNELKKKEK